MTGVNESSSIAGKSMLKVSVIQSKDTVSWSRVGRCDGTGRNVSTGTDLTIPFPPWKSAVFTHH